MITDKLRDQLTRGEAKLPLAAGKSRKVKTSEGDVLLSRNARGLEFEHVVVTDWPDLVIVVSLQDSPRRESLARHLTAHGIAWRWLDATSGANAPRGWRHPGAWGCLRSHEAAVRAALAAGAQSVLVLEDDARLVHDFTNRLKALMSLECDALWLGGRRSRGGMWQPAGRGMVRSSGIIGAHCYVLRRPAMTAALEEMANANKPVDHVYGELANRFRVLAPASGWLSHQVAGHSYILGRSRAGAIFLPAETEPKEGAIILSTGTARRKLALNAASSVRRCVPALGVQIVSDAPFGGFAHRAVKAAHGHASRLAKIQLMTQSPWETGVVLDDDTLTLRPFHLPSVVLGGADIAMACDPFTPTLASAVRRGQDSGWLCAKEAAFMRDHFADHMEEPHFNSGVIFFRRSPAVLALCAAWLEEWQRFRRVDQMALFRAIRQTGIQVKALDRSLHCRVEQREVATASIVHFCGKKWTASGWMEERGVPIVAEPSRGCCGGRKRTLRDMAAGVARAVGGVVADVAAGRSPLVSRETRAERRAVCQTCEHREGVRCGLCKCFLSAITWLAQDKCEAGRWQQ